jgi:RNA polymerase sigma factor (sigma-70 family)
VTILGEYTKAPGGAMHDTRVLVHHAVSGDDVAWRHIVRSYAPLLASVCRRYGLSGMDSDDIAGRVWLHLVVHIARLREPAALPGWLKTTTRRECRDMLKRKHNDFPLDGLERVDSGVTADARLLAEEQWRLLRQAIDCLTEAERKLLALLFRDPPTPYVEISAELDMPVGAIGPTRQRILKRLRRAHVWRGYRPTL